MRWAVLLIRQVDLPHLTAALLPQALTVAYCHFAALLPTDAAWRERKKEAELKINTAFFHTSPTASSAEAQGRSINLIKREF